MNSSQYTIPSYIKCYEHYNWTMYIECIKIASILSELEPEQSHHFSKSWRAFWNNLNWISPIHQMSTSIICQMSTACIIAPVTKCSWMLQTEFSVMYKWPFNTVRFSCIKIAMSLIDPPHSNIFVQERKYKYRLFCSKFFDKKK